MKKVKWLKEGDGGKLPTADVAPRAEVAREIFWEMDKLLLSVIIDDEAEESFVWLDFDKYLALKKKYTDAPARAAERKLKNKRKDKEKWKP